MDSKAFDHAMVTAAFAHAGLTGWSGLSIVEAARSAGLPLDEARMRFPGPAAVLQHFGLMADAAALAEPANEPLARDRLFDLLMRRIDVLQQHRSGMLALLSYLPRDPALSLALGGATLRSMAWMLEAAGVSAAGLRGTLRAQGLVAVWVYTVRAWRDDESADLASTMAALDKALDQAERFSSMLQTGASSAAMDDVMEPDFDLPPEPDDGEPAAPDRLMSANPPPPPDVPPPASP